MRIRTLMILLSALLMVSAQAFGQAIIFDSVGSAAIKGTDTVKTTVPISFYIRFNNSFSEAVNGYSNAFRVFSDDGAQWQSTTIDSVSNLSAVGWGKTQHDGGVFLVSGVSDGALSDTVGIGAFALFGSGSAINANGTVVVITTGAIPAGTSHGLHICIDSSYFAPGTEWVWSAPVAGSVYPTWSGQKCYTIWDQLTGVGDGDALPHTFSLAQNYPNPFNPTTSINYSLAEKSHVELSVYNVLGQKISTLVSKEQTAGEYSAPWDASQVASGVYFYRLETEKFTSTKKMMLVK
jgi:Secretion system C-terminal sorting domain